MHNVETMAYAHETPWHGLGTNVDPNISTADMLEAAGLNWQIEKIPVGCVDDPEPIANKFALRRSSDKRVYSIVSPAWKPVQNHEILNFFRAWTEAGAATLETAGSLRNGAQIWALANLGMGFSVNGQDPVKGYVLMVGSHESGTATIIRTTSVRVVCANTLALSLKEKPQAQVRVTHVQEFNPDVAKAQMGLARETMVEFGNQAEKLQKLKLSNDEFINILQPIYQQNTEAQQLIDEPESRNPTIHSIMWSVKNSPGSELTGDTGWGLLNAATYHTDHLLKGENKLYKSWMGYQSRRKEQVHKSLMELVA